MPRVWIRFDTANNLMSVSDVECWDGVPVEMNASLYRQIQSAVKKFWEFQDLLGKWYLEKPGRIS